MRVCPKCGFVDPPIWKQSAFHQNISFTEFGSLELEEPELSKRLAESPTKRCSNGPYAYKLTRFYRVERQAILENPNWEKQWDIPAENSKQFGKLPRQWRNPALMTKQRIEASRNQSRLLEREAVGVRVSKEETKL
jgi:hypothetical protein